MYTEHIFFIYQSHVQTQWLIIIRRNSADKYGWTYEQKTSQICASKWQTLQILLPSGRENGKNR